MLVLRYRIHLESPSTIGMTEDEVARMIDLIVDRFEKRLENIDTLSDFELEEMEFHNGIFSNRKARE